MIKKVNGYDLSDTTFVNSVTAITFYFTTLLLLCFD